MNNKYLIKEITSLDEWEKFVHNSLEYTMFLSKTYLQAYGGNYKLYFIKKGIEIKAAFCILLSKDSSKVILDELIIYGGILFHNNKQQKRVKANFEKFEITENIIKFLTKRYNKIQIALSPEFKDMRPFLWHNYGACDKTKTFCLDLRYTTYLNISELKTCTHEEETTLFKNLETLRQRNIRKARQESTCTKEELNGKLFLEYYLELMKQQNQEVSKEKLDNMLTIINQTIQKQQAVMFTARNSKGTILYITVFAFDHYRAYYLFGASNPQAKEPYKGTICFWDSFIILAKKYGINEVDLEGVNSPQRGWFKLSFGGELKEYYEIQIGDTQ